MEQKEVSRRDFFRKTAVITGAAAAAYSLEERELLAFQQREGGAPPMGGAPGQGGPPPGGARGAQVAIPDIPGPVPTFKLGGIPVSRLLAGHNLVVGQAHEGGSGLIYVSSLLRAYFTEAKVLETFSAYEKSGINISGARMAANMLAYSKKYMAQGGKLAWLAGISSEKDIAMATEMGARFGYVHGNTADGFLRNNGNVAEGCAKLLDAMRKANLVSGICCHNIDVVVACEKAGVETAFYIKTFNPVNYYMNGTGVPANAQGAVVAADKAVQEEAAKKVADVMAGVKVPFIGFKTLGAGRANPTQAFTDSFKLGCDGILVGMYDFQVAQNANLVKKIMLEKDKLGRTRPWVES